MKGIHSHWARQYRPHDHVLLANVVEMLDDWGGWTASDTVVWREHLHAATAVGRTVEYPESKQRPRVRKRSMACHHRARITVSTRRSPVVALVVGLLTSFVMIVPNAVAAPKVIKVTPGAVDAISNGNCSIREAIVAANTDSAVDACTAGSGADTINARGTFVLTTADNDANGLPVISSTIRINNASISRASEAAAFRIFAVASTGNLALNAVTVRGGLAPDCPNQAGDVCGGGIANGGTLSVHSSRIVNNAATGSAFSVEGGAIYTNGTATVASSVVSGNSATNTGSSFSQAVGGGIVNTGTLNVRASRFNGNVTSCSGSGSPFGCFSLGGAIYNSVGTLGMKSSEVASNTASCSGSSCFAVGGGITNDDISDVDSSRVNGNTASCSASGCTAIGGGIGFFGTVNLTNSQVIDNTASCSTSDCLARGGGLDNCCDGTLNVTSSRVANNTVSAPLGTALGGGLMSDSGTVTLTRSSVTSNAASGAIADGGGIYKESGSVILNKTRVSGNTPNNCTPPIGTCT